MRLKLIFWLLILLFAGLGAYYYDRIGGDTNLADDKSTVPSSSNADASNGPKPGAPAAAEKSPDEASKSNTAAATDKPGNAADKKPALDANAAKTKSDEDKATQSNTAAADQEKAEPSADKSEDKNKVEIKTAAKSTAATAPAFDVVRVDPEGTAIFAGRATPGSSVKVESKGDVIGEATADNNGDWMIMREKPIRPGKHEFSVVARAPGSSTEQRSSENVALSVSEPEKPATKTAGQKAREESKVAAKSEVTKPRETPKKTRPVVIASGKFVSGNGEEGQVVASGQAEPGQEIRFRMKDREIGSVKAGANGEWALAAAVPLKPGSHDLQAQQLNKKGEVVATRNFTINRPKPVQKIAAAPSTPSPPKPNLPGNAPGGTTEDKPLISSSDAANRSSATGAAETESTSASSPAEPANEETQTAALDTNAATAKPASSRVKSRSAASRKKRAKKRKTRRKNYYSKKVKKKYRSKKNRKKYAQQYYGGGSYGANYGGPYMVIRRGDTLWDIARRRYGDGRYYVHIYRHNRKNIRNPNLIFPRQRIRLQ